MMVVAHLEDRTSEPMLTNSATAAPLRISHRDIYKKLV